MRSISKNIPVNRMEQIASGENITPESREEVFAIASRLGGGDFLVQLSTETGRAVIDKTYKEIVEADAKGNDVRLVANSYRYRLAVCDSEKVQFTTWRWVNNKARMHYVTVYSDDTIEDGVGEFNPSSIPG